MGPNYNETVQWAGTGWIPRRRLDWSHGRSKDFMTQLQLDVGMELGTTDVGTESTLDVEGGSLIFESRFEVPANVWVPVRVLSPGSG